VSHLKNIWSVYYFILITSSLVLAGIIYNKQQTLHEAFDLKHSNSLNTLTRSIESSLTENELILDLIGERLRHINLHINNQKTQKLLQKSLVTLPNVASIYVISTSGQVISSSDNSPLKNKSNLLKNPLSKSVFNSALNKAKMVIGRTHFCHVTNQWIVPLYKAIRDHQGQVFAVVSIQIKLSDIYHILGFSPNDTQRLTVINSANYFPIFISHLSPGQFNNNYQSPMSEHKYNLISASLQHKYGITLKETKTRLPNIPLTMPLKDKSVNIRAMSSIIYNSKYDLWVSLQEPASLLQNLFLRSVALYIILFLGLHLLIIWAVKRIHKHEKKVHDTLLFQSEHDALTGLYNRHYLEKCFTQRLPKKDTPISLLFIDLDNFKHINDTFGHSKGDKLLVLVAKRLTELLTDATHIIRFGGDEFVVVLTNKAQQDTEIAKQIIETISVSYRIDELTFTIGASVGIARDSSKKCQLDTLLSHADLAMYEAKKHRNWAVVFSESLHTQSQYTANIEHQLRSAMTQKEIYMNYQPQLNKQGKLHGVECLVRWQNESLGFVPPDQFISVAEDMGIMPQLGHYITETSLTEMAALQKQLNQRFQVSINISLKQFMDENFFEHFIESVSNSKIPFKYITIEVTESLLIEDIDYILSILDQFRRKEIAISLDDFGTGFSSLSLLRQLPIQELKIDKAFVDNILENPKEASLVKNIINIANDLGMYTLSEGVENADQLAALAQMNCDLYQGYHFSRPLSAQDLPDFILNHEIIK